MKLANHFLDALRPADLMLIRRHLTHVKLSRETTLAAAGQRVDAVVLPVNCVISVVAVMNDGRSVETRTIGCESGFGLLHGIGSTLAFENAFVQIAGDAWRLPVADLRAAAEGSPALVHDLACHAQATLFQSTQSAACNTLHSAEQRLARWLLLTRERTGGDIMPLTQEHLATMLGVQRTTVTAIASGLQQRGLVAYSRGRIRITDRTGLISVACECYEAIEQAGERMREDAEA